MFAGGLIKAMNRNRRFYQKTPALLRTSLFVWVFYLREVRNFTVDGS